MPITMYDAITVSEIPSDATAVAGYVGGFWPDYSQEVARFPNAKHLSIAVTASEDADCLDIENGDAVPAQAGLWATRQIKRGVKRPVLYSDRSEHPAVVESITAAGLKRSDVRYWIATLDGVEQMAADADATQWTDRALGRNLDQSICADDFFGDLPAPKPVNLPHYDWFYVGLFNTQHYHDLNERQLVLQYDGARQHPVLYAAYLKFYLRPRLKDLADRVRAEAVSDPVNGKPSNGKFYRGWRFQQLIKRAQGQRFV